LDHAREAEVDDLRGAVGAEHDVFGLEVAVHEALAMGVGQPLCKPSCEAQRVRGW